MHTSHALRSDDFQITVDGGPATVDELLPGFDEDARLGIVITSAMGGAGASGLILAAVTAFYDRLRASGQDFFAYADFFALHVGGHHGSLSMLDVYPEHKEPVIEHAESEAILQTINDRAITHLLVPDGPAREPQLQRETLHSARRRIRSAIAYSPTGHVDDPDVRITASATAEEFVTAVLGEPRAQSNPPVETYRRIPVDRALGMLEPTGG